MSRKPSIKPGRVEVDVDKSQQIVDVFPIIKASLTHNNKIYYTCKKIGINSIVIDNQKTSLVQKKKKLIDRDYNMKKTTQCCRNRNH